MKSIAIISAIALLGLSVAGCSPTLQTVANVSAKVSAATPTVVMDLNAAGMLTADIAAQIAAANPNNANIQAAVTKLDNGIALTSGDAAALAPAVQLVNGTIQIVAATAK